MIHVRRASGDDVPWLLAQLREFSAFFGTRLPLFPANEGVAEALVHHFVQSLQFFIAIDNRTMRPVGFIAGSLGPHPMNPDRRLLAEVFWWVAKDRRGSTAGWRLLDHFVNVGRHQADWVVMTLEAQSPVDPTSLERMGFHLHERSYLMEVAA